MSNDLPEYLRDDQAFQDLVESLLAVDKVKVCSMLADSNMRGWLVRAADAAVVEMNETFPRHELRRLLDINDSMIKRRIRRHRSRVQN